MMRLFDIILTFVGRFRSTRRMRLLNLATALKYDLGTRFVVFACRTVVRSALIKFPDTTAKRNPPPDPTSGSESAPMLESPTAIFVGIPRDVCCWAGLRDFLNFLKNDMMEAGKTEWPGRQNKSPTVPLACMTGIPSLPVDPRTPCSTYTICRHMQTNSVGRNLKPLTGTAPLIDASDVCQSHTMISPMGDRIAPAEITQLSCIPTHP